MEFNESKLKIERAKKHIIDLNTLLTDFVKSDFYSASIEKDAYRTSYLKFDLNRAFPLNDSALILGDSLHNLRSALDLMFYQTVLHVGGIPTDWTHFPIRDKREILIKTLNATLEKKQINALIFSLIADTIKPYEAGNYAIWALHDLNIRDKHQLLIPVLQLMKVDNVSLEDGNQIPFMPGVAYFLQKSSRVRLDETRANIQIKDKGQAAATILFNIRVPFEGKPVIPTLNGIAEEVSRTIEAFEIALSN